MIADEHVVPMQRGWRRGRQVSEVASQWQLIRWKFMRHRIAVFSLVVLMVLYLLAIFPEFFSPYLADDYDID